MRMYKHVESAIIGLGYVPWYLVGNQPGKVHSHFEGSCSPKAVPSGTNAPRCEPHGKSLGNLPYITSWANDEPLSHNVRGTHHIRSPATEVYTPSLIANLQIVSSFEL